MDEITPSQWIARCGAKLHERWQTVEPAQLEEVAVVIWQDINLRALPPDQAAEAWLSPIAIAAPER
jgi:hypothetical protein